MSFCFVLGYFITKVKVEIRKMRKIKSYLIASIAIILGIAILYFTRNMVDAYIRDIFRTVGISLITTSIVSILTQMINKKDAEDVLNEYKTCVENKISEHEKNTNKLVNEFIREKYPIVEQTNKYGLVQIMNQFPLSDQEVQRDFIDSSEVSIVMNDGKAFISSNTTLFNERLNQPEKTTNMIILDYEEKNTMEALTKKNAHKGDYYVDKIKDVIDYHLRQVKRNRLHRLNVYLSPFYNTMSIVITDKYAMISLYRVSPGKDDVPHLIFKNTGEEYNRIKKDVDNIMNNNQVKKLPAE